METRPYRPAVRVIISKDGKIAVGERIKDGKVLGVKFPGGGIDPGDSFEQTTVKEVLEEVGYLVEDVINLGYRFSHDITYDDPERAKKYRGGQDNWMLCSYVKHSDKLLDSQGDSFKVEWYSPQDVIDKIKSFPHDQFTDATVHAVELAKERLEPKSLKPW